MTKVTIIGVGYVGEHLLQAFMGPFNPNNITGVDVSSKRVTTLKQVYPTTKFQSNYDGLEDTDVFLVSVPTLVNDDKTLDLSPLKDVSAKLKSIAKHGSLVVVESSVYVGATRELFSELLNNSVNVAFSPERVDPGRIEPRMDEIPKVVSGLDLDSLHKVTEIYERVFQRVVPVSSTECAEMCKLYENCFRMVNIAYVNEISDMCKQMSINPYEMISAASTKPFGFMPFYPGLGVGGHCIPVNPYYLFKNGQLPVLEFSTKMMESRPEAKVDELLQQDGDGPTRYLIVGIGFKKGEKLTTNSPGYEFVKVLQSKRPHNKIGVYDPVVHESYYKNDIMFEHKRLFNANTLCKLYDVIVVNLPQDESEQKVIKEFEALGGKVVSYVNL